MIRTATRFHARSIKRDPALSENPAKLRGNSKMSARSLGLARRPSARPRSRFFDQIIAGIIVVYRGNGDYDAAEHEQSSSD